MYSPGVSHRLSLHCWDERTDRVLRSRIQRETQNVGVGEDAPAGPEEDSGRLGP